MYLIDILKIKDESINLEDYKLHLAVYNGYENPLDVFLSGKWEKWQSIQNKKNFNRKFIISLIQIKGQNKWLFVGIYKVKGVEFSSELNCFKYETIEMTKFSEFAGRLIVYYDRKISGRNTYLLAEKWHEHIVVDELLSKKLVIEKFPGYNNVKISKQKLDIIIAQNLESWEAALSNVSGIYLISDTKTGKLYVGKASGENGIWQRWTDYSLNGHGGNRDLVKVLNEKGSEYSQNFQYSILEITDTHSNENYILARESYWKDILCSKEFGYNAN